MRITEHCSEGKEYLKTEVNEYEWKKDAGEEERVINIYPEEVDTQFEGFGGAITDAAGYVFQMMDRKQQEEVLDTYFAGDKMNYQFVRIHIDSCDFSTHMYSAIGDKRETNFDFSDTERYILPLLDAAQKRAGRKLKLMLSPWSPPSYMKTNGKRTNGGELKAEYRSAWAEHYCRYILEFQERGYEVQRISVQNEPKAVQTWDSCIYTGQQEKEFLRDYLLPALKKYELNDVEVFIWDHNKERMYERANEVVDEITKGMIAGIAFHWYSGDHFEALDIVRRKYPDLKMILSESCLEFCKYDMSEEKINAERLAHDMIGNLNNGMQAFYDWNILLDNKGGPNHVQNYCDAPFLYHQGEKKLEKRMILKYYWHFAHFIKPLAKRVAHTKYTDELEVTAWKNPNGDIVLIVLNRNEYAIEYNIRLNGEIVILKAPQKSITSNIIKYK